MGFIMAFLAIKSAGYFKAAIYFLISFFATGVIYSIKFSVVNSVNIHPSWLSAVVFSYIVILFLTLVYLGLVSMRVTTFFSLSFLFPFLLSVVNYNSFLYKIYKGNFLLVCFIDFIFNFRL
jgi:hypothetical protein